MDDQPEGAVPSEAEAEADGTGGVVLVTGDGGSAADAASSPMRPSEMPSFTSLIGSSLEIGAPPLTPPSTSRSPRTARTTTSRRRAPQTSQPSHLWRPPPPRPRPRPR